MEIENGEWRMENGEWGFVFPVRQVCDLVLDSYQD